MDFICVYELRERLRIAMIAGSSLIEEDFRYKRAIEEVRPLANAAPVFKKLVENCEKLLDSDKSERPSLLADTIILTDAVICTLESVVVKEEVRETEPTEPGSLILDIPRSELRTLITALTEKGHGHYNVVNECMQEHPEYLKDFRVIPALVKALGAPDSYLADMVCEMMKNDCENHSYIPLLKKDFNPVGRKEMERRLRVIIATEKAAGNDFYLEILPKAKREIRLRTIAALRYSAENLELLKTLCVSEKGDYKEMAHIALEELEQSLASKNDEGVTVVIQ